MFSSPLIRWLPSALWYGLILGLTLPARVGPEMPEIPYFDKLCHFAAFAGQAFWIWLGFRPGPRRAMATLAACAVLGALDEFMQYFMPGRSCEFADWLADMAGAVAVVLVMQGWSRWRGARG